jgi:hypothetical protein
MCYSCGCGEKNSKYDMQPVVFTDAPLPEVQEVEGK